MKVEDRGQRRRRVRGLGVVLALTAVGALGAACSSGSSTPQVASLPGHSGASSPTNQSAQQLSAQSDQDMVNFAHCMRQHGVQMSDPFHIAGHSGLSISLPQQIPSTQAAYAACNHFIAKDVAAKNAGAVAQSAPHLQALTNYASCMRRHDVSMPDPPPNGQLNLGPVPGITNGFGRYSPQFRSADAACRHLLPAGTRDDGTGP
jgi:hypothetical protein